MILSMALNLVVPHLQENIARNGTVAHLTFVYAVFLYVFCRLVYVPLS